LLMYLPYFVAEAIEMSGIVATLFAGIATRHYAHVNLSPDSQVCVWGIYIYIYIFQRRWYNSDLA
jgi:NhaP-type Na+/H+ or K+/H+ antiporter